MRRENKQTQIRRQKIKLASMQDKSAKLFGELCTPVQYRQIGPTLVLSWQAVCIDRLGVSAPCNLRFLRAKHTLSDQYRGILFDSRTIWREFDSNRRNLKSRTNWNTLMCNARRAFTFSILGRGQRLFCSDSVFRYFCRAFVLFLSQFGRRCSYAKNAETWIYPD